MAKKDRAGPCEWSTPKLFTELLKELRLEQRHQGDGPRARRVRVAAIYRAVAYATELRMRGEQLSIGDELLARRVLKDEQRYGDPF